MNMNKRQEILLKLKTQGMFSEIDSGHMRSFKELYGQQINAKIAIQDKYTPDEKLIAAAPQLLQIAEMFHDHMVGNEMERTMVFNIVSKVLQGVK